MKSTKFNIVRYDADEGMVFDWKEPRWRDIFDENMNIIDREQEHLNVKTIFIGGSDSIENYIEVDEAGNATELVTPNFATEEDYEAALAELGVE